MSNWVPDQHWGFIVFRVVQSGFDFEDQETEHIAVVKSKGGLVWNQKEEGDYHITDGQYDVPDQH